MLLQVIRSVQTADPSTNHQAVKMLLSIHCCCGFSERGVFLKSRRGRGAIEQKYHWIKHNHRIEFSIRTQFYQLLIHLHCWFSWVHLSLPLFTSVHLGSPLPLVARSQSRRFSLSLECQEIHRQCTHCLQLGRVRPRTGNTTMLWCTGASVCTP